MDQNFSTKLIFSSTLHFYVALKVNYPENLGFRVELSLKNVLSLVINIITSVGFIQFRNPFFLRNSPRLLARTVKESNAKSRKKTRVFFILRKFANLSVFKNIVPFALKTVIKFWHTLESHHKLSAYFETVPNSVFILLQQDRLGRNAAAGECGHNRHSQQVPQDASPNHPAMAHRSIDRGHSQERDGIDWNCLKVTLFDPSAVLFPIICLFLFQIHLALAHPAKCTAIRL